MGGRSRGKEGGGGGREGVCGEWGGGGTFFFRSRNSHQFFPLSKQPGGEGNCETTNVSQQFLSPQHQDVSSGHWVGHWIEIGLPYHLRCPNCFRIIPGKRWPAGIRKSLNGRCRKLLGSISPFLTDYRQLHSGRKLLPHRLKFIQSGNAIGAFLQTPAPVLDKILDLWVHDFLSRTGLG